jgi:DNA-binding response OmpR family regulator
MAETIIKALLIEDDLDDSQFLQDLLETAKRARFAVDTAYTAKEGISSVQKGSYDLILLDYRLPDKDGLEVLSEIRQEQYRIPVIMVTSHGDRSLQNRALDAKASDYLEKGAITADLLERVCLNAYNSSQVSSGRVPELEIIVNQVSSISKDLTKIRTETVEQHTKLENQLNRIGEQIQDRTTEQESKLSEIHQDVKHLAKFRWVLDWLVQHPFASIAIFICVIVSAVVAVLLMQSLDIEIIRQLLELKKSAFLMGPQGWFIA